MINLLSRRLPQWMLRILTITVLIGLFQLTTPSSAWANASLQLGSKGATVEQLQTRLRTLGYFDAEIDGVYSETTRLAVKAFQKDRSLPADGIAGAETQRQLAGAGDALQSPRTEMPPDIQRILDRGKLIVALLGTDNPPFFMDGDTTPAGLDIKIAQGLAEALDVDLEFNRSAETFNEVVDQVYQLKADIAISKLSRTLSRAKRVRFSRPYVTMRQGLLVNRLQLAQQTQGNQVIEAIRNFNGDVGVIQGSSYVGFIKQKFPKATIREYPTWDDIVDAVVNGDIQAAYRDELEVKKIILKNPDSALRLQTIALTDTQDQIAMALPWDSEHLQDFVNQYLDTFNLDYTADAVLDEYSDYFQSEES